MKKLMSVIVAAMFAVSTAFVAAPVGAQPKDEKPKAEQKKGDGKKKAEGQKAPAKKEGDGKKTQTQKKGDGKKKDEGKGTSK